MRYLILPIYIFFLYGCSSAPAPQDEKEILAQAAIQENIDEAQQARSDYLALQEKRRKEGTM